MGPDDDRLLAALPPIINNDYGFLACRLAPSRASAKVSIGQLGLSAAIRIRRGSSKPLPGLIRPMLERASEFSKPPRLLLTAHGLPKKIVSAGDPYPRQVELTARADCLPALARPNLDWQVCYQSRVGPLEWIGPATEAEIRRAGAKECRSSWRRSLLFPNTPKPWSSSISTIRKSLLSAGYRHMTGCRLSVFSRLLSRGWRA